MNKKAKAILDKTITLLTTLGTVGVSMDEISAYAGASKMTVYKYFSNKAQLFDAAGQTVLTQNIADLAGAVDSGKPLVERMYAFIGVSTDFVDNGSYHLSESLAATSLRTKAAFANYVKKAESLLRELIDEGFAEGYFKPGLDRQMVFDYLNMGIAHYQRNATYRERMKSDTDYQNRMMTFLVSNIFLVDKAVYPKDRRS